METNFIRPSRREFTLFNLNHVYKIEKDGVNVTFYLINGENFTVNSGHVPSDVKRLLEGDY